MNTNLALKFMAGFAVGALIGAGAAILFAPGSGAELRDQIHNEIERVRNEVSQAAADRRIELEQQLSALRSPAKREPGDSA
jgi:gas vesicle protein